MRPGNSSSIRKERAEIALLYRGPSFNMKRYLQSTIQWNGVAIPGLVIAQNALNLSPRVEMLAIRQPGEPHPWVDPEYF
jgi:hypothetical protein